MAVPQTVKFPEPCADWAHVWVQALVSEDFVVEIPSDGREGDVCGVCFASYGSGERNQTVAGTYRDMKIHDQIGARGKN